MPRIVPQRAGFSVAVGYAAALGLALGTDWPYRAARLAPAILSWKDQIAPLFHVLAFAGLAGLALAQRGSIPRQLVWAGLVAAAALTELLQGLLPQRVADPADFAWNLLGVAAAGVATGLWMRRPIEGAPVGIAADVSRRVQTGPDARRAA